ncbi:GNAT family N-acetyltransferase [Clostridium sp. D2Q-14]|uniref:GNAT family N-acetyltransferase n=1 Tax=Anaeromonas gelatinilytica TaxID=2683194 RepID=UPI00193AF33E|nr:GNAT family protein [Anaeromonas gelatinilytica]MBS4535342.1 GNAT family N-acetyltransferase [Anaeromonas gelatinilytica]
MLIEYNELLIRNAKSSDAQILCKWWNDGKVMSHAGFPKGLGTTCEEIEKDLETDSDETRRRLIIEYRDEPIGEMSYKNQGAKTVEIGIKICDFTKLEKGLGTIVLRLFIRSLFEDYNFQKIILDTNLDNKRAQHVYEKIGFRRVKINYDSWKNQFGELQSSVNYELKKEDFRLSSTSM